MRPKFTDILPGAGGPAPRTDPARAVVETHKSFQPRILFTLMS